VVEVRLDWERVENVAEFTLSGLEVVVVVVVVVGGGGATMSMYSWHSSGEKKSSMQMTGGLRCIIFNFHGTLFPPPSPQPNNSSPNNS